MAGYFELGTSSAQNLIIELGCTLQFTDVDNILYPLKVTQLVFLNQARVSIYRGIDLTSLLELHIILTSGTHTRVVFKAFVC